MTLATSFAFFRSGGETTVQGAALPRAPSTLEARRGWRDLRGAILDHARQVAARGGARAVRGTGASISTSHPPGRPWERGRGELGGGTTSEEEVVPLTAWRLARRRHGRSDMVGADVLFATADGDRSCRCAGLTVEHRRAAHSAAPL